MMFTQTKFLSLALAQQHKKCAQMLRLIYEKILHKEKSSLLSDYQTMLCWMNLPSPSSFSLEILSDLYHEHLLQSGYAVKEHNLLPSLKNRDRSYGEEFLPISIFLDHVRSAYNVGSILRTTEAMRLGSVYFSEKTPFIDNEKVHKTSMGSYALVPSFQIAQIDSLPRPWIALETSENAIPLHEFLFPKEFTLILGNEEYGISTSIVNQVDYLLEIPLQGCKNSLNVACAYAIAAAEIRRQKIFSSTSVEFFNESNGCGFL
jgi:tRNA G18 (ribose-2'-O)-methylase SpoU